MRHLIGFVVGIVTACAVARSETRDTRIEIDWSRGPDLPASVAGNSAAFVDAQLISAGGSRWQDDKKQILTSIVAWKPGETQWRTLAELPAPMTYSASAALEREL